MDLSKETPIYEVFGQHDALSFATHVGSVRAASAPLALLLARETYFRRDPFFDLWVVPQEAIARARQMDWIWPDSGIEKSYRVPAGYDNAPLWKRFKAKAQTIEEVALDMAPPRRSPS